MLYTATLTTDALVFPLPSTSPLDLLSIGDLAKGTVVNVMHLIEGWALVTNGVRAGWIDGAKIKKNPILLVDLYHGDKGKLPDWSAVVAAPGYAGAILKATEGTAYPKESWVIANWPRVKAAGGARYGVGWFRGAYHFLKFNLDGTRQADYYLKTIEKAGGWDEGDLLPIVDVELGADTNSNRKASAQQIIDCTSAWSGRVKAKTGRDVILYGRGAMRDKNIKHHMGCKWLWNPSYTSLMKKATIERVGWTVPEVAMWQYCGDGTAFLKGYPKSVPNFGEVDISVFLAGTVDDLRTKLCAFPD
jgi:GH25 family lysozyme M1 (1,4-beta-N-acetylmuramidase)